MINLPVASVIVPVFNASATIAAAVQSAREQSLTEIELIVIDDASTDDSWDQLKWLAQADPRIRLDRLSKNSGPAAARNRGLQLARGKWIGLLDADDRFTPKRLDRLVNCATSEAADMIADNLLMFDGVSRVERGQVWPNEYLSAIGWMDVNTFVRGNSFRSHFASFGYMKPLFRRAFLERHRLTYDSSLRLGEDYQMYLDCLLHAARWRVIPDTLYLYALTPLSATRRITPCDFQALLDRTKHLLKSGQLDDMPGLRSALEHRADELRLFLKHQEVIAALKNWELGEIIGPVLTEPGLWPFIAQTIREGTLKRLGLLPRHGARI
jgi:glycosyltransferase involved in cell wall biosynthesis